MESYTGIWRCWWWYMWMGFWWGGVSFSTNATIFARFGTGLLVCILTYLVWYVVTHFKVVRKED